MELDDGDEMSMSEAERRGISVNRMNEQNLKVADVPKAVLEQDRQPVTMLNDRVLVHLPASEGERRSRSGILIPATAAVAKRLSWSEVAAAGPHVRTIKVGDTVLFDPEECFEVEVHGEQYLIVRERDLHAVASSRLDSGTGLYL